MVGAVLDQPLVDPARDAARESAAARDRAPVIGVFDRAAVGAVADNTGGEIAARHRTEVSAACDLKSVAPADDAAVGVVIVGDRHHAGRLVVLRIVGACGSRADKHAVLGKVTVGDRSVRAARRARAAADRERSAPAADRGGLSIKAARMLRNVVRGADHAADRGALAGDGGSGFAFGDRAAGAEITDDAADVAAARHGALDGAIRDRAAAVRRDAADIIAAGHMDVYRQIPHRARQNAEEPLIRRVVLGIQRDRVIFAVKDAVERKALR